MELEVEMEMGVENETCVDCASIGWEGGSGHCKRMFGMERGQGERLWGYRWSRLGMWMWMCTDAAEALGGQGFVGQLCGWVLFP